jgi:hypothetical protein
MAFTKQQRKEYYLKNKDYEEVVLFVPENTHKNNLAFYKAEVLK